VGTLNPSGFSFFSLSIFGRELLSQRALIDFVESIARAEAKKTLANLAYNIDCLIFHERRAAVG